MQAIEAVRAEGYDVVGVVSILDRLAGGAAKIALASDDAPYEALATIDDVYPDRPDRVAAKGASGQRRPRLRDRTSPPALRRRVLYPLSYEGRARRVWRKRHGPVRKV